MTKNDPVRQIPTRKITEFIIAAVITVIVIVAGIKIPEYLLIRQERSSDKKKGSVNIEDVHPYGAEIVNIEKTLVKITDYAFDEEWDWYKFYDMEPTTVYKLNGYKYMGDDDSLPNIPSSVPDTPVYSVLNSLEEYFGFKMADTLEARVTDIPGDNPQIITYGYGDRLIILDKDSEIPALFHYVFRRPDNAYLPGLWARIVRIYSDTTGIDFISSSEDNPDYSYGDYVYYYRRAVSGDGNIELVMVVEGRPVIKSVYASKTEETEAIEYDEQKDWTLDIFVISTVSSLI